MLEADSNGRHLSDREIELRRKLQEELWLAATSYESLLRQKARTKWIKEGDCNSKFFHITVNGNRRHNSLRGLLVDGCWTKEPIKIKEEVCQFFRKKFEEGEEVRPRLDGVTFQTISQNQNDFLVHRFDEKEVKDAVWDCGSHKSPGLDGLNFKFIKGFWEVIKPEVLRFLDEFYVNDRLPKGTNASFIALIPKVPEPQNLNQYRPISLIGCIYKIVAKVLARRLKRVLPEIIDE